MSFGRITVVGDGGLLGEIVTREFARRGELSTVPDNRAFIQASRPVPDVVAFWAAATQIGRTRRWLRLVLPPSADPLLVFFSQSDPHTYFTRLRDMHVDRRRLGFADVFDEIAARLVTGSAITTPARAGAG